MSLAEWGVKGKTRPDSEICTPGCFLWMPLCFAEQCTYFKDYACQNTSWDMRPRWEDWKVERERREESPSSHRARQAARKKGLPGARKRFHPLKTSSEERQNKDETQITNISRETEWWNTAGLAQACKFGYLRNLVTGANRIRSD